ncbi:DUF6457 domain-containing protein [Micromonospora zhanjiangensis]|uniref:DUF6457 domain-containing protein n=1 Tax=Micromonospora zhanjiangensis TaxID=1522057 RepID=A0ABV8KKD1_9ACTN
MNELDRWLAAARAELGLDADEIPTTLVLDVARDVAHQVLRPGAPVTAYLLGLAVGRGADPAEAAAKLTALARDWTADSAAGDLDPAHHTRPPGPTA